MILSIFLPSKLRVSYGYAVLQSSHSRFFQKYVVTMFETFMIRLFANQVYRQPWWMCRIDPEHLQGANRGLSTSLSSIRQIRQTGSSLWLAFSTLSRFFFELTSLAASSKLPFCRAELLGISFPGSNWVLLGSSWSLWNSSAFIPSPARTSPCRIVFACYSSGSSYSSSSLSVSNAFCCASAMAAASAASIPLALMSPGSWSTESRSGYRTELLILSFRTDGNISRWPSWRTSTPFSISR